MDAIEILPAAFLFMRRTLGVIQVSRKESQETLSYVDYLLVYYKSYSEMNQRVSASHLKLYISDQEAQSSTLQNKEDSYMVISP